MSFWDRIFHKKQKDTCVTTIAPDAAVKTETPDANYEELSTKKPAPSSKLSSQYDLVLTNDIVNMLEEQKLSFSERYPTVRSVYIQNDTELPLCGYDEGFFKNHPQLESVVFDPAWSATNDLLDASVQTKRAFQDCAKLKKVILPDAIRLLGNQMFQNCTALSEITLPERLEEIEWSAFENCTSLEEVSLLTNIRQVGRDAFKGCTKLRRVTILSDNLEGVDFNAFSGCDALEIFEVPNQMHLKYLYGIPPRRFQTEYSPGFYTFGNILAQYTGEASVVEIPPDIEYIGAECFRDNKKVCSVKMSEKVRVIGTNAFRACKKLKQCEMPGVEYIGFGAFATSGIESAVLPQLKKIPQDLFENCRRLEKVVFPDSCSQISFDSGRIFTNCENLMEAQGILPFRTISKAAFQNCKNLKSIVLSEGTEIIGNAAFQNCSALCSVELPQTLHVIEPNAFLNTALKEVRLPDNMEKISLKATENVIFIVTKGSITHQYCVKKKLPFLLSGERAKAVEKNEDDERKKCVCEAPNDFSEQEAIEYAPSASEKVGLATLTYSVVGTDYSPERTSACESLKIGDSVVLEREPDNDYDPFAIMVKSKENKQCGYLPAELAKWLSVVLDAKEIQISHASVKEILLKGQNGNRRKHTFLQIDIQIRWNAEKYLLKMNDNESEIFLFRKAGEEILPAELYRENDDIWDEYKTYCQIVGEIELPDDIDYEADDEEASDIFATVENSANGIQFIKGANERLEHANVGDRLTFERCFTNARNQSAIYVVNAEGEPVGYVAYDEPLAYLLDNDFITLASGNITRLVKLSERKKENPRNRTAYLDFTINLKSDNPKRAVEEMERWLVKYNADLRVRFSTPSEPQYWQLESVISDETVKVIEWISTSEEFDENLIPLQFKQKRQWKKSQEDEMIVLPDNLDELLAKIGMDIGE